MVKLLFGLMKVQHDVNTVSKVSFLVGFIAGRQDRSALGHRRSPQTHKQKDQVHIQQGPASECSPVHSLRTGLCGSLAAKKPDEVQQDFCHIECVHIYSGDQMRNII